MTPHKRFYSKWKLSEKKAHDPDIFTFPTAWWGMTGVGKSNFKEHGRSVLAKGISPGRLPEAGIGHGEPKQVKVSGAKTPATPQCGVVLEMKVVYGILPQHQPFRPLYTLLYGLKSSDSCSFLSSYRKDWIFFLFCRVHKPHRGNPCSQRTGVWMWVFLQGWASRASENNKKSFGEEKVVMTKSSPFHNRTFSCQILILRVMIHVEDLLPLNLGLAGDCSGVLS